MNAPGISPSPSGGRPGWGLWAMDTVAPLKRPTAPTPTLPQRGREQQPKAEVAQ